MLEVVLFLIALWLAYVLWPLLWRLGVLAIAVFIVMGLIVLATGG